MSYCLHLYILTYTNLLHIPIYLLPESEHTGARSVPVPEGPADLYRGGDHLNKTGRVSDGQRRCAAQPRKRRRKSAVSLLNSSYSNYGFECI